MSFQANKRSLLLFAAVSSLVWACVSTGPRNVRQHGWWRGLGPVLPHESFPADCQTCHVGREWQVLRDEFSFDHEAETGVALTGAHTTAQCLRCHNDRGPVADFAAQGCAGCHEDIHFGLLGPDCTSCHTEQTWQPVGQVARHNQTRFPLSGIHAAVACFRCHPGAEVGKFVPTTSECVACHADDLARALLPPHVGLGWVDNCQRCHIPTDWKQAAFPQ